MAMVRTLQHEENSPIVVLPFSEYVVSNTIWFILAG